METISEIAENIKIHRELELSTETVNNAIGRSFVKYDNEEKQFWLIQKPGKRVEQRDIVGNVIPGYGYTTDKPYRGHGFPVPRDSTLGAILIQNHEGKHKYKFKNGEVEIEIYNRTSYKPDGHEKYASDLLIKISGDQKTHSYQDIVKILTLQIEIDDAKLKLEESTELEAQELIEQIEQKEKEKEEYLKKAQGFIRKHAELRFQPILDPIQDSIRRSKPFDGNLIINGGPGTGKTTSLIQRIKFLISPTIEEVYNLTEQQKTILYNQATSWIFYSPNELLALFLQNSMKMEELSADKTRVKVWNSHKSELIRSYKLVDTTTKRPFLFYNKSLDEKLLPNNSAALSQITSEFEYYFIEAQRKKLEQILAINFEKYSWGNLGVSLQSYIQERINFKSLEELLRLFYNLENSFSDLSTQISQEYLSEIKNVSARLIVVLKKDTNRIVQLETLLKSWKEKPIAIADDEETEIEQEVFDEKEELNQFDFESDLFSKMKSNCRKHALKIYDSKTSLTKRNKEFQELVPEVKVQDNYQNIGQLAFYKKYIERSTKGIAANILREIPKAYKTFRKESIKKDLLDYNYDLLKKIIAKDNNVRLHVDEQAFLLHSINNICRAIFKTLTNQFSQIKHPYVRSFKENIKPVIGIDEATDFSLIDLVAIESFSHPSFCSVTFSGDIMQRMTTNGLISWNEIIDYSPNTKRSNLEVSYRQSPTLLSLASNIYEVSTGEKPIYRSYLDRDDAEPKPLMIIADDEETKINWLAERIIEIYKNYGDSIPSIAIFLPNESLLENFASKLGNEDLLADVGILVKACRNGEVLGDKNTVRVFAIDKIKGLEFEAVFFFDIDDLANSKLPSELILKYLYVGLSRATFYLGIVLKTSFKDELKFLNEQFVENENWLL